jgi:hypothetical protein
MQGWVDAGREVCVGVYALICGGEQSSRACNLSVVSAPAVDGGRQGCGCTVYLPACTLPFGWAGASFAGCVVGE